MLSRGAAGVARAAAESGGGEAESAAARLPAEAAAGSGGLLHAGGDASATAATPSASAIAVARPTATTSTWHSSRSSASPEEESRPPRGSRPRRHASNAAPSLAMRAPAAGGALVAPRPTLVARRSVPASLDAVAAPMTRRGALLPHDRHPPRERALW